LGRISLVGLVNVPVKVFSATESKDVHFHDLRGTGRRIHCKRVAALEQSLKAGRGGAKRDGALEALSKQDVSKRAGKAGIAGRSKMSREQLVKALRKAS
jgi:hypothetical protein